MSNRRDIEAAAAYVRLYTKGAEWTKGLHRAGEQLTDFGQRINSLAKKLALAGGAIGTPLVASIKAYVDLGSELQDVSDRVGIQVDALAELRFAADQSGSNITALEKTLRKMQVTIAEAANGSKAAGQSLAALGFESQDFIGLYVDQQFEKIADALISIPDTGDRIATAMDLMGRSAAELMPLFDQGAAGIRALRQQAKDLGLSIDPEQAAKAEALGDSLAIVGKSVSRLAFSMGNALEPAVKQVAAWITKMVTIAREWIERSQAAVLGIAQLAVGFFAVSGALAAVAGAIQFVGFSLFGLAAITKTLSIAFLALSKTAVLAFAAITSPIGIAIGLLAGLAGYALYASGALTTLSQGWSALGETANAAWSGIVAAVGAGDMALAGEIAMTALEVAWLQVTTTMQETWNQLVDFLYQPWQMAVDWITDSLINAFFGIQSAWAYVTTSLMSAWDIFISYAETAWQNFSSFFQQLWADMVAIVDQQASDAMTNAIYVQKQEYVNRQSDRQKQLNDKLAQNNAGYEQQRAAIQSNRDTMRQTLDADRQRRDRMRNMPNEELEAKRRELVAKQTTLSNLTAKAKTLPPVPGLNLPEINLPELELSDRAVGTMKTSAAGSFSGIAARGLTGDLGGSHPMERTARATERTAKNTDAIRKSGGIAYSP